MSSVSDTVVAMRRSGMSIPRVAAVSRLSVKEVRAVLKCCCVGRRTIGERLKAAIPRLNAAGLSDTAIAKRYGCTQTYVTIIRRSLGLKQPDGIRSAAAKIGRQTIRARLCRGISKNLLEVQESRAARVLANFYEGGTITEIVAASHSNWQSIYRGLRGLVRRGIAHVIGRRGHAVIYRLTPRYQGLFDSLLNFHDMPVADEPCPHPPGTPKKLDCLCERRKRRQGLWHPQDATSHTDLDV